jgi:hypothetical protein
VSRKTTRWRQLGRQAGEGNTSQLEPRRATGRARFRCTELDNITLERAFGKVCCLPMGNEKLARFRKVTESGASTKSTKKGWK